MYLLDTNVVSEIRRPRPHGGVRAWLNATPGAMLHVSAVTLGELQAGAEKVREQDASKATEIEAWIEAIAATFNVLAMDGPAFRIWARILVKHPRDLIEDAMIAATAEEHGLVVVTRNVKDFEKLGARTFNPFEYQRR